MSLDSPPAKSASEDADEGGAAVGVSPGGRRDARRFLLDNVIVLVAQVLQRLRGLITLPLIVQGLGTASYGIWAQFVAFTSLAAGIMGLSLHLPLVRAISADPRRAAVVHTTLLAGSFIIGTLSSALLLGLLPDSVGELLLGSRDRRFLLAALIFVVFANARSMALSVYRATDRIAVRSLVELCASLVDVAGVVVILLAGHGLDIVVLWMAGSSAVIAVAASAHALTLTGLGRPSMAVLRSALEYSLPLLPSGLAQWVLDRSDRVLLAAMVGQVAVGAYSAHYAVASLVLFIQAPLQVTLVPKVSSLWDRDRTLALRYLTSSFRIVLTAVVPFAIGLPLVAPELFLALANQEVAELSRPSTFLIAIGVGSWGLAIVVSLLFYASGRTTLVALVTLGAAATNVLLNLLLLPRLGLLGASAATAVAYSAALVANLLLARPFGFSVDLRHAARCLLAAGFMAAAVTLIRQLLPGGFLLVTCLAVPLYFGALTLLGGLTEDLRLARSVFRR